MSENKENYGTGFDLKKELNEAGITAKKLAQYIKRSPNQISRYCTGRTKITEEMRMEIKKVIRMIKISNTSRKKERKEISIMAEMTLKLLELQKNIDDLIKEMEKIDLSILDMVDECLKVFLSIQPEENKIIFGLFEDQKRRILDNWNNVKSEISIQLKNQKTSEREDAYQKWLRWKDGKKRPIKNIKDKVEVNVKTYTEFWKRMDDIQDYMVEHQEEDKKQQGKEFYENLQENYFRLIKPAIDGTKECEQHIKQYGDFTETDWKMLILLAEIEEAKKEESPLASMASIYWEYLSDLTNYKTIWEKTDECLNEKLKEINDKRNNGENQGRPGYEISEHCKVEVCALGEYKAYYKVKRKSSPKTYDISVKLYSNKNSMEVEGLEQLDEDLSGDKH